MHHVLFHVLLFAPYCFAYHVSLFIATTLHSLPSRQTLEALDFTVKGLDSADLAVYAGAVVLHGDKSFRGEIEVLGLLNNLNGRLEELQEKKRTAGPPKYKQILESLTMVTCASVFSDKNALNVLFYLDFGGYNDLRRDFLSPLIEMLETHDGLLVLGLGNRELREFWNEVRDHPKIQIEDAFHDHSDLTVMNVAAAVQVAVERFFRVSPAHLTIAAPVEFKPPTVFLEQVRNLHLELGRALTPNYRLKCFFEAIVSGGRGFSEEDRDARYGDAQRALRLTQNQELYFEGRVSPLFEISETLSKCLEDVSNLQSIIDRLQISIQPKFVVYISTRQFSSSPSSMRISKNFWKSLALRNVQLIVLTISGNFMTWAELLKVSTSDRIRIIILPQELSMTAKDYWSAALKRLEIAFEDIMTMKLCRPFLNR